MLQQANWITTEKNFAGVPLFRRGFSLRGALASATLYITALGLYEAKLNGTRVGDFILAPGWTSYKKRLQYQSYDVTELLTADNTLTVALGDGWCCGPLSWEEREKIFADQPALLCSLVLSYADGSTEEIQSDGTWEYSACEILESELYDGEVYDSRKTERSFAPAALADYGKDMLIAQEGEIIREVKTVKARELLTTPAGETVIDFGQNLTGYVRFCVKGNSGDRVVLSHAEVLDKDGNFYTENLRKAKQQITFICDGTQQCYKPHFTFQGFRYIRIDEYPGEVNLDNFEAVVLCSDMKRIGHFECSNPKLNQLYSNIVWGQMSNYVDVPTDCPQRDERLGWTGDAQVFIRAGAYNFDVRKFFKKWLHDLAADQLADGTVGHVVPNVLDLNDYGSAAWGDAATICPWQIYLAYGDKEVLANQFDSAKAWVEHIRSMEQGGKHLCQRGFHFGDWLGLDAEEDSYRGATDDYYIASAFYAYSTLLLVKMGKALGKDMAEYEALYDGIVRDFRAEYLNDGKPVCDTQTAHVLALYFGLTDNKEETMRGLVRLLEQSGNHLTTGFVGTPYLLHVLSDNGRADLAYTVLLQEDYPSWLYSVNKGATTMWEHWDGIKTDGSMWSADMNSFNHYAYGAVGDWLYGVMCGINPDENAPGYRHSILRPVADTRLDAAQASVETDYGTLSSGWKHEGGDVCYRFTVPQGTTATILVEGQTFEVGAGSYTVQDGKLCEK